MKNYIVDPNDIEELNSNDGKGYYVIDLEKLDGLTLNYGYGDDYSDIKENGISSNINKNQVYFINSFTHKIYFPYGIINDKTMYYSYGLDEKLNITELET